jgi:uncharacterized protein YciW
MVEKMPARITPELCKQLENEANRKLAAISRRFAPNGREQALKQKHDRLDLALALADVTELQETLQHYRDLIAAEIKQHNNAQSALSAYSKSFGAKSRRAS